MPSTKMKFQVIYQDKELIVINKPAGLIVFPEGNVKEKTLIDQLIEEFPELKNCGQAPRYGIIHRLDKDTSGVILIAKNNESLIFFQKEFKNRAVRKTYIALVSGNIKEDKGIIKGWIGRGKDGKKQVLEVGPFKKTGFRDSKTLWKVVERFEGFTLLLLRPKTGRKHQIRVHLTSIGHPIVADKVYSFKNQLIPKGLNRQFLHCYRIIIKGLNGEIHEFVAPLPEELKTILNNLKTYENN
ncbi:MAG: RluA family pseudouridine synthase [Candidatus Pacebacteria bacterium]|nr:RluA family pseudouridine synthase [Candidatus Paceibacterota bacterium]